MGKKAEIEKEIRIQRYEIKHLKAEVKAKTKRVYELLLMLEGCKSYIPGEQEQVL